MNFDLAKILQSKREFRTRLAARPIAEKLAMLDALRERMLAIRPARPASEGAFCVNSRRAIGCKERKKNEDETWRTAVGRSRWRCASTLAQGTAL